MADFEITQVSEDEPRAWATKDGKAMLSYEVEFKGATAEGYADINKLSTSKPPRVGEVYGELAPAKGEGRKATLKKVWKQDNGSQGQGSRGNWSPEKERSIVRQHSQKVAVMWLTLMQARGKIPEDAGKDFLIKYIDFFQDDAEGKLT